MPVQRLVVRVAPVLEEDVRVQRPGLDGAMLPDEAAQHEPMRGQSLVLGHLSRVHRSELRRAARLERVQARRVRALQYLCLSVEARAT